MREPHCFEMTAALPMLDALDPLPAGALEPTMFLPAAETWIEFRTELQRKGYFLRSADGEIEVNLFTDEGIQYLATFAINDIGLLDHADDYSRDELAQHWLVVAALLALINTPRLVGRREHCPHRVLTRELAREGAEITLRAWTEVLLELTPRTSTGDSADPERLSGRKCLHFCRSHLRFQNGRLVVVRPHWRGDVGLGVKQSDYRVAA